MNGEKFGQVLKWLHLDAVWCTGDDLASMMF